MKAFRPINPHTGRPYRTKQRRRSHMRPNILTAHARIHRNNVAQIVRFNNGRYCWNPALRQWLEHMTKESANGGQHTTAREVPT